MKRFKVVGWYVDDPHNELSPAYALVVHVRASNRAMAFDDGEAQLRKIAPHPDNLLNWFVQLQADSVLIPDNWEARESANIGGDDDVDAQK